MAEVNKEVQEQTNYEEHEDDFASMLEESFSKSEGGEGIVEGTIVDIKEDSALVDVGKKSEGRLNISEITDEEGNLKFNVGDKIKVAILGYRNERPIISYKKALRKEKVREFIKNFDENSEEKKVVEGVIIAKNRGGFIVESDDGVEFFLPKSQAAFRDLKNVIGRRVKAYILKIDKDSESIVISRKKYLDAKRRERAALIKSVLNAKEPIEGVIKKITSYGMFVDVGGIDGLVHYSEISYKGPVNPAKYFEEGDKVFVKAINYDKDKRHLSLSVKAAMPDPWEDLKEQLEVGDTIKVTVSNIEPYGVFVDLGNDIEGFLHVSEISWDKNIKHPKDYLKVGEEIDVEVIEIDTENRRLRVSLKALQPKPFEEFLKKYKVGDVVKGVITTITNFGAFVKIDKVEGLLHNEDASWDKSKKCKDLFKVGDEVEVKIINIDKDKEKISLSKKELEESPIDKFIKSHKNGDVVKGKVRGIKDFGVFVEIESGVDALIRKEDLGDLKIDELKVGDEIEAAIAFMDKDRKKIRLSVRKLSKMKEREALNSINEDEKITLGDIIKEQLK